jgi:rod shape-determining protein MreC
MFKHGFKIYLRVLGVSVLLIFFHWTGLLSPVENVLNIILKPFMSSFYSFSGGMRSAWTDKVDKVSLEDMIRKLEKERNDLMVENVNLKMVDEENKTLRAALKFSSDNKISLILGNVIAKGKISGEDNGFIINKGSRDGIAPDLAVTNGQNIIVGKIMAVKDDTSEICFLTNQECKFAVSIQNQNHTSGVAEGNLDLTIKINFIPQTEELKTGEVVISSGLEPDVPRGLIIGNISRINKEDNELWQNAVIEPLVKLDYITIVAVVLPGR